MASLDLSLMTVIELRKLAKEKNVRLGAGLSKEGIIQKLSAALEAEAPAAAEDTPVQTTEAKADNEEAQTATEDAPAIEQDASKPAV